MEVVFLGTSSMVPTKERNHAGAFVAFGNEGILLDCGEGIQRQLRNAGISLTKVTIILISHWHGDHVLGLPGLIQSLASMESSRKLRIFGPRGTKKRFGLIKKAFVFEEKAEVEIHDVSKRIFFETNDFKIESLPLEHSTACIGFSIIQKGKRRMNMEAVSKIGLAEGPALGKLQEGKSVKVNGKTIRPDDVSYLEKGKKITYITDTGICNNAVELAENADLLVCESTYADDLEEKAEKYKHLTARQAGMIANKADVKNLVLTHFSQRYKTVEQIEEDAKTVFSNVRCAFDYLKIRV